MPLERVAKFGKRLAYFAKFAHLCRKYSIMKITLSVQESKLAFFLELLQNFDFVQVNPLENPDISEEHLAILEERLVAYKAAPDHLLAWETVKASIEKER